MSNESTKTTTENENNDFTAKIKRMEEIANDLLASKNLTKPQDIAIIAAHLITRAACLYVETDDALNLNGMLGFFSDLIQTQRAVADKLLILNALKAGNIRRAYTPEEALALLKSILKSEPKEQPSAPKEPPMAPTPCGPDGKPTIN